MAPKLKNNFSVVRRVVPLHGVKIGCSTETVAANLTRADAIKLADAMQVRYLDAEYAVVEHLFRYFTKPEN